ncbi:MazG nucleotide pyrophosphohydrolase domain-containing protein [Flavobacterium sp.]|uniref:MazG nucleotide pyrophosphohydrolase domain-containing protein n=1 Tax=Flavobacterium sp. TaxID=239 RepID=UPI003752F2EB
MNLKNSQQEVDNWIKNHGVRYFNELTNMAQLTEEVGEVARIIARRYGEQSEKESDKNKDLGEELADVVFVEVLQTWHQMESYRYTYRRHRTHRR